MKKIKIILVLLIGVCSLTFLSCDDLLEEKSYDFAGLDTFEDSDRSAQLYVNGVLGVLNSNRFLGSPSYMKGLELDTDYCTAGTWAMGGLGAGNFSGDGYVTDIWNGRYELIYRCNFALNLLQKMNNLDPEMKNNYMGQLYFLRGWALYQVVRFFGPCPVYDKLADTPDEFNRPRESVEKVYERIIEDLKMASDYMFPKTDSRYEVGRISKYAAKTLLAEVYTFMASASMPEGTIVKVSGGPARELVGDELVRKSLPIVFDHAKKKVAGYEVFDSKKCYEEVRTLCQDIIKNGGYDLFENYMDTWSYANRNGKEFIWQIQASSPLLTNSINNDWAGAYWSPRGSNFMVGRLYGLRDHWYELSEDKDLRVREGVLHRFCTGIWTWGWGIEHRIGHEEWYFYPLKDSVYVNNQTMGYKNLIGEGGKPYPEYWGGTFATLEKFAAVEDRTKEFSAYHYPVLRYPVVYLMLAEAENELNNPMEASKAIDVLRNRAKATTISDKTLMNKDDLRAYIIAERARELALEGYRRVDLLRWGVYVDVMNKIDIDEHTILKRRQDRHVLMPIPQDELAANKAITENNPGW